MTQACHTFWKEGTGFVHNQKHPPERVFFVYDAGSILIPGPTLEAMVALLM
jgi:hypothetical protein